MAQDHAVTERFFSRELPRIALKAARGLIKHVARME